MPVKFGKDQLGKPTPRNVGRLFKIVIAVCASITGWVSTADFIPSYTAKIIGGSLGLVTMLCLALEPFFGVHTRAKKIDIDDVTEMKNKP